MTCGWLSQNCFQNVPDEFVFVQVRSSGSARRLAVHILPNMSPWLRFAFPVSPLYLPFSKSHFQQNHVFRSWLRKVLSYSSSINIRWQQVESPARRSSKVIQDCSLAASASTSKTCSVNATQTRSESWPSKIISISLAILLMQKDYAGIGLEYETTTGNVQGIQWCCSCTTNCRPAPCWLCAPSSSFQNVDIFRVAVSLHQFFFFFFLTAVVC